MAGVIAAGCDNPRPSATVVPGTSEPGQPSVGASPAASAEPSQGTIDEQFPASAADLIQADVEQGALDQDTGLLYRIYAVFRDPRLPAKYQAGVAIEDEGAFEAAQASLDSMAPEIAAELRPYLVRPTDPSSVFHEVARSVAGTARLASWRPRK